MYGHESASHHHPCSGEGLSVHPTWGRPQRATIPSGETTWEVKSLISVRFLGQRGGKGNYRTTLKPGFFTSLVFELCLLHKQLTGKTDLVVRAAGGA